MTLRLSPEQALLVRACAPPGHPSVVPLPDSDDLNWARLVEQTRWHRLSGLLWRHLRAFAAEIDTPPEIRAELQSDVRETATTAIVRAPEVERILGVLSNADIPVMLLKGSVLVETIYPDSSLRPMSDIDMLVPSSDIRSAQRLVEDMGYRAWTSALDPDDDRRLAAHAHHFPLLSPKGDLVLELHQHLLVGARNFHVTELWARARPGAGPTAHLLPSAEDLFLHVAVHFADDRVRRWPVALGQVADLAWIADRSSLAWNDVQERARSYGLGDRVFLALMTMDHLLPGLIPEAVAEGLRPASFRPSFGEQFVAQRVLRARSTIPIERFVTGERRLFPGRDEGLGSLVRPDEAGPSVTRLQMRRAINRVRKLIRASPTPRELLADLRLSRWIMTLRTMVNRDEDYT